MTYKRAKYQGQRSTGFRARVETDGRTDTTDRITLSDSFEFIGAI